MKQVHFTMLEPETHDIFEPIEFRCDEPECKDLKFNSSELFDHARDIHNCGWVKIDSSVMDTMEQSSLGFQ